MKPMDPASSSRHLTVDSVFVLFALSKVTVYYPSPTQPTRRLSQSVGSPVFSLDHRSFWDMNIS